MTIITNKKGAKGFTCTPWNFIGPGHSLEKRERGEWTPCFEVQYMIRPVTIHSCGKKQMYLIADDESGDMHKRAYRPDTPVYATVEDAKAAARDAFPAVVEATERDLVHRLKTLHEDFSEYKWCEQAVIKTKGLLARVRAGDMTLSMLTLTEWKENRNKGAA